LASAALPRCAPAFCWTQPYRRDVDVPIEYVGLRAPDAFIVGYGLDYQEKYRNLPYLVKLRL
jgi:hypoxanthine phosphoribosyltransferase